MLYTLNVSSAVCQLCFNKTRGENAITRTSEVFKNSSCLFHCNPTERQIYLLKKFQKIIYIVDNDIPGWKACLKLLKSIPGKVEFLRPPERPGIKDINDILQGKDSVLHTVQDLVDLGWLKKVSDDKSILELLIKEKTKSSYRKT